MSANDHVRGQRMGGGIRTPEQREADLRICEEMFIKAYSYQQIADEVNRINHAKGLTYTLKRVQIFRDMQKMLAEWKKERFDKLDDYIQSELRRLDKMEKELWEAWEQSKTGKQKTKTKKERGGLKDRKEKENDIMYRDIDVSEESVETTTGDPRYMDLLLDVQQRRAKLLGYEPKTNIKMDLHKPDAATEREDSEYNFEDIPEDMLAKMVEGMMRANSKRINDAKKEEIS